MHFGFGFGIITSFGFGQNFGSKTNRKPKFDDIPFSHSHLLRTKKKKKFKHFSSIILHQTFFIKHFLYISGVSFKLVVRTLSNQLLNSSSLDIRSFVNFGFGFGFGMLYLSVSVSVSV
jgi:hypothetical protein